MSRRRTIGKLLGGLLIGCAVIGTPAGTLAATSEPGATTALADCSDPDSFGGAADVGDNRLTVEKTAGPAPKYRLIARWGRWDGQNLAASAERDLGRTIDWGSPRLVVRVREESQRGVTLVTQELIANAAEYPAADLPGGAQASLDVEPALFWPRGGGTVSVKLRVERPGLDLATCWAKVPSGPTLDGAARSSNSLDFAALP
jgi:hypothetical protein